MATVWPKGLGNGMKPLARRSPSIVNSAWGVLFMWDGRAASLEAQALGPIAAPPEMNQPLDRLVRIAVRDPPTTSRCSRRLPAPGRSRRHGSRQAIATYERTIVSGAGAVRCLDRGRRSAISAAAKRGFALFNGQARGARSAMPAGISAMTVSTTSACPTPMKAAAGCCAHVLKMQHAFKTPGLREIARRGPVHA